MFNIYTAAEKDIRAIISIAEITWWPAYGGILVADQIRFMLRTIYSPDIIRNAMLDQTQIFLILEDAQGPQAFAAYGKRPDNAQVSKLHKLYVLPDNQGHGYGKALIDEIKTRLLRSDVRTLDLNVNRQNPARGFYEKVGFKVMKEEDIRIGPYWMNDYVMRMEF